MFFPTSLLTWLITQRSRLLFPTHPSSNVLIHYPERVLMAGIRFMGLCPCPRCLVKKRELLALGTPMDNKWRLKVQVNDHHFCTKVSIARTIIYGQGRSVNTEAVNDLLKERSLVPTTVGLQNNPTVTCSQLSWMFVRMHSTQPSLVWTLSHCLLWT